MAGNWTPCGAGTAAEMRFAAAASERGIGVCVPWGHAQGYDLVTDCDGVLRRVQVKLSAYRPDRDRFDADVRTAKRVSRGDSTRIPSTGQYDVLAVVAGSSIYLIPQRFVLGRSSLVLRPPGCHARRPGGPVAVFNPEDWCEAWSALKEDDSD